MGTARHDGGIARSDGEDVERGDVPALFPGSGFAGVRRFRGQPHFPDRKATMPEVDTTPFGQTQLAVWELLPEWPDLVDSNTLVDKIGKEKKAVQSAIDGLKKRGLVHTMRQHIRTEPFRYCRKSTRIPRRKQHSDEFMQEARCGPLYAHGKVDPLEEDDAQYVANEVCPKCPVLKECERYVDHLVNNAYGGADLYGAWAGQVMEG